MSKKQKNNKGFSISKKMYVLTLIFALLIGAGGTLVFENYFANNANESEENTTELDSESDAYTQYLFGDSEELSSVNKMLTILKQAILKNWILKLLLKEL